MVTIYTGSMMTPLTLSFWQVVFVTAIVLSFYVALHVLRAIGLYKLAKRKNIKGKIWAIVPLAWIFVAIKLVGETKLFKTTYGKFALLLTAIVVVSGLIELAFQILVYYPLVGNILLNDEIKIAISSVEMESTLWESYFEYATSVPIYTQGLIVPYANPIAVENALVILSYFDVIFRLATIFITVTVFINLFKKYWPDKFVLATILSVLFGLFPIFVFVIRNKKEVNYQEYIRKKYQYQRNPYGAYGQGNPYSQNPYQQSAPKPPQNDNPFEEFGGQKNNDPFEEFSDKSDK